jgi:hypothetical protein
MMLSHNRSSTAWCGLNPGCARQCDADHIRSVVSFTALERGWEYGRRVKHSMWQELGFSEDRRRALPGQFAVGVLVPQALFFAGFWISGLGAGLAAATAWSLIFQLYGIFRKHTVDPFLLYGLIFTVAQGTAALWTHSPAVYAGGGIAENFLGGILLLGSTAARRPVLVEALRWTGKGQALLTLSVQAALRRLTVHWAFLFLGRSVFLYAALTHLTIGQFLFMNTITGWPLNGVWAGLSVLYLHRCVRPGTGRGEPSSVSCATSAAERANTHPVGAPDARRLYVDTLRGLEPEGLA